MRTFKEIVFVISLLCLCLINNDVNAIVRTFYLIDEATEKPFSQLFEDDCGEVGTSESFIAEIAEDNDTEAVFVLPKRKSEQFYKISRSYVCGYEKIWIPTKILNFYTNLPPPFSD